MSIMGKQITLGQLLGILVSILIPVVGFIVNLAISQAELRTKVEGNSSHIQELKEDRAETNRKLDTIIGLITELRVKVENKQDRR